MFFFIFVYCIHTCSITFKKRRLSICPIYLPLSDSSSYFRNASTEPLFLSLSLIYVLITVHLLFYWIFGSNSLHFFVNLLVEFTLVFAILKARMVSFVFRDLKMSYYRKQDRREYLWHSLFSTAEIVEHPRI